MIYPSVIPGIAEAVVCKDSGKLPTDLCIRDPRGSRIITDIFVEGKIPEESCDVHVAVRINTLTGKPAGRFTFPLFIKESVYIKRPYIVDSRVEDYQYQIPAEYEAISEEPEEEPELYKQQEPDKEAKIEIPFKRGKKKR